MSTERKEGTPTPWFMPLDDGGTLIEWESGDFGIQIELLADGSGFEWNVNDKNIALMAEGEYKIVPRLETLSESEQK